MTRNLQAPADCISRVRFAPGSSNTHLLVSSWDREVRLYNARTGDVVGSHRESLPVMDCTFLDDARQALSVGLEKKLLLWDFQSMRETQLGQHEEAIRCVEYHAGTGQIFTGSWDRTVRAWDPRQPATATSVINLGTKVFTMDCGDRKVIVGGSDRCVHIFDMRKFSPVFPEPEVISKRESLLKHQLRALKIGVDPRFYASGSVEGRVGIEYFDLQEDNDSRYAFKCHRVKSDGGDEVIHPVNALSFHPVYGTFATGGSDGSICVWDPQAKKRLWKLNPFNTGVSSLCFSGDGTMLAIGVSYTFDDDEKTPTPPNELVIRQIVDSEVMPKPVKR